MPRVGRVGGQSSSARGFQKHPPLILEALDKVHLAANLALALHPVSTRLGFFYRREVPAGGRVDCTAVFRGIRWQINGPDREVIILADVERSRNT